MDFTTWTTGERILADGDLIRRRIGAKADIKAVKPSSLRCRSVQKAWFQPAPHGARTLTSTPIYPAGETLRLPVRCAPRKSKRLSKAHARQHRRLPHKRFPPALRWHPPAAARPPDSPLPSRPPSGCRRSSCRCWLGWQCRTISNYSSSIANLLASIHRLFNRTYRYFYRLF